MSLLASPKCEFLDEPTTGVDPVSRRSLFKMLKNLDESSLVLTTHRMDEAESLCDNIVIMINGRFVVYGSPGHLKDEYGLGYIIKLRLVKNKGTTEQYVQQYLPFLNKEDDRVTEETFEQQAISELTYNISDSLNEHGGLSTLFSTLCHMQFTEKMIIEFQVTRSSLEQVFVKFAKHQI